MILPSSKEEGKQIKKRYCVFNFDGSLAELKGFEVKRRGELKLIKFFQKQLFSNFLKGSTLKECYLEVAKFAKSWLDLLDSKASSISLDELLDLIVEHKSMSKSIKEYEKLKSTSITTVKRMSEFLDLDLNLDKNIQCKYLILKHPTDQPVSERAVPSTILQTSLETQTQYLKKWLKLDKLTIVDGEIDLRSLIDWDYYRERLVSVILKLIVIPSSYQNVPNPFEIINEEYTNGKIGDKIFFNKIDSVAFEEINKNHTYSITQMTANLKLFEELAWSKDDYDISVIVPPDIQPGPAILLQSIRWRCPGNLWQLAKPLGADNSYEFMVLPK